MKFHFESETSNAAKIEYLKEIIGIRANNAK